MEQKSSNKGLISGFKVPRSLRLPPFLQADGSRNKTNSFDFLIFLCFYFLVFYVVSFAAISVSSVNCELWTLSRFQCRITSKIAQNGSKCLKMSENCSTQVELERKWWVMTSWGATGHRRLQEMRARGWSKQNTGRYKRWKSLSIHHSGVQDDDVAYFKGRGGWKLWRREKWWKKEKGKNRE